MQHHSTADAADSPTSAAAPAWDARAQALAGWAWDRLAVRTDVWGGYRPLAERGREYTAGDGTRKRLGTPTTHPRQSDRGKVLLTRDVLVRHFRGALPEHVVGLHSTSADNRCRWGALDLDCHGETSTAADVNLAAALHWYDVLAGLSFRPLLTDSNGAGGYHLRVLFAELVPAPRVYGLLRWLIRDHAALGFPKAPETYPKQASIPPGRFGNWLRLPGRHHTRNHWSTVYDGRGEWLAGAEAVDLLLSLAGDPATLIPAETTAPTQAVPVRTLAPRRQAAGSSAGRGHRAGNLSARIAAYLARLPNLGEGQGRTDVAYQFAAWLVRDLDLSDNVALDWLDRWDAANSPPLGRARLAEIAADARRYGRNAVGCGLDAAEARPAARPLARSRRLRPGHKILSCTVEVR